MPASSARLVLVALLVLAAGLRLLNLGTMPGFNGDEGYEAYYAWQVGEHFHLRLNPVRPYLGPYFLWLVAPILAVAEVTPFAVRLVPALGGVLGAWIAWRIGRRWGDERLGLTLAALFASAAWAVAFQRVALSVMMLPLLTLVVVAGMLRAWDSGTARSWFAVGLGMGAAAAFHPQGLLLGPVVAIATLVHPEARAVVRRPRCVGAAALGFALTAWVVWAMVLDQVGLGPGIDYSGTLVTPDRAQPLLTRLAASVPILIDVAAGPRGLRWFTGVEPAGLALAWPARVAWVAALGLGLHRAWATKDPTARALLAALTGAWFLTAARAADFDLAVVSRERYLLVALTLTTLAAGYGLAGLARLRGAGVAAFVLIQVLVLQEGFFGPYRATGGHPEPSMVAAAPDAKLQAARWMLDRLQPGEEGLILAGDGWSYWPLVAFTTEAMPMDFVPEDPERTAAILERTRHRRRFLVDYHEWHWTDEIRAGLAAAGHAGRPPAFAPLAPDGRPILTVWELPPEVSGTAPPPPASDPGGAPR